MVALLRVVCAKMGGDSPMLVMLTSMLPLVEQKILTVPADNITSLATLMAQSFARVADPDTTVQQFDDWLAPLNQP